MKALLTRFTFALIGVLVLISATAFTSTKPPQVKTTLSDPVVIVIIDGTNQFGPCVLTHMVGKGAAKRITSKQPCPPGTYLYNARVKQSQAIKEHESFIPLSSSAQQLDQLMQQKRNALRAKAVRPNTSCNPGPNSAGIGANWRVYGDNSEIEHVYMEIDYEVPAGCSNLTLDSSHEYADAPTYYGDASMYENLYGSYYYYINCSVLTPSDHVIHIDQVHNRNLDFLFKFQPNYYCDQGLNNYIATYDTGPLY